MTKKICFIGNAGSGKTTLSADVFVNLKKQHRNAELVSEFVRTDIHLNGPMTNIWEQYRTRANQAALEDAIPKNVEFMLTDSGVLTPFFYASLYVDKADARQRIVLGDMYRFLINDLFLKRYSHVFFIPMTGSYEANPDILDDGTRFQTREEIDTLESHMNLIFSKLYRMDNVHVLDCPISQRCEEVMKIITR